MMINDSSLFSARGRSALSRKGKELSPSFRACPEFAEGRGEGRFIPFSLFVDNFFLTPES
jgi:hypothetical protein